MKFSVIQHVVIATLFIEAQALFHRCPPKENLSPCSCKKTEDKVQLLCARVTNKDFKTALSFLQIYAIDEITVRAINDLELPPKLFQKIWVHNINIINCNVLSFSLFKTFHGIHEVLNSVQVANSTIRNISLSTGTHFIRMVSLLFESTTMVDIQFSKLILQLPKYLKKFRTTGNAIFGIDFIESGAFSRFPLLTDLDLSHNRLVSLERSMFPNPTLRLQSLMLSYNRLSYLADDFFTAMPRLEFLYLDHNPLLNLRWELFKPIWHQLAFAGLQGIGLSCNCELAWIIRFRPPAAFKSPSCNSSKAEHVITELSIPDLCQQSQMLKTFKDV